MRASIRSIYQLRAYLQVQRIMYLLMAVAYVKALKAISNQLSAISEEDDAETILFKEANSYINRWNQAEEELASLMHLVITRPIPTVVTIGGIIDITYLLDTPHDFDWKGVYMDADHRAIEAVQSSEFGVQSERQKTFMQLSSLQGSILENRIFEDDFQVESISTAKLIQIVSDQDSGLSYQLLTIDSTNIDDLLPTLSLAENIEEDIRNAVNQNLVVHIPQAESSGLTTITYHDWTGVGYIKENPDTGESGWMLSGMVAGGMTVITPEEWADQYLKNTLSQPYSGEYNDDPLAAARIIKITVTDRQYGTVGRELAQPLAVLIVDRNGIPVKGASVTFRVIAGGGNFNGVDSYPVTTGQDGIARAPLTLGTVTADNPNYIKINTEDEYYTQIGLNLATASVSSYSGDIPLTNAFSAYGKPDIPAEIIKVLGNGNRAIANNPAGSLVAKVADQYGNPISNQTITFSAEPAVSQNPSAPLPINYRNIRFYRKDECNDPYPIYGDCAVYYDSISLTTGYFGSVISTVLGDTVNTKYTVEASVLSLPSKYFTLYSTGNREDAGDYIAPSLYIRYLHPVNDEGQPVNASKAGTQLNAPLVSELFMQYDEYTMEGPYTCIKNGLPTDCYRISPTGIVKTQIVTDGTVTYTSIQGGGTATPTENLGNGQYQTWYTTGPVPEVNRIEVGGEATVTVPEVLLDPSTGKAITEDYVTPTLPSRTVLLESGQGVLFNRDTKEPIMILREGMLVYTVFGVDIDLIIEPGVIVLNEEGYTGKDTTFRYTILPSCEPPEDCLTEEGQPKAYNAVIADIDFYRIDENNNEEWAGYLTGDSTQGEGTGVFIAGSYFDITRRYEAEVVLNRGGDIEIRGERVPLNIVKVEAVSIAADNPSYVKVNYRVIPADVTLDTVTFSAPGTTLTRSNESGNESGEFYFIFNQNDLPLGSSTISLTATKSNQSVTIEIIAVKECKETPESTVKLRVLFPHTNFPDNEYDHRLYESYCKITYSIPFSGQTILVTKSNAFLNVAVNIYEYLTWIEEHKYVNESFNFIGLQEMNACSGLVEPSHLCRESSNNLWLYPDGLRGVGTTKILWYNTPSGLVTGIISYGETVERSIP